MTLKSLIKLLAKYKIAILIVFILFVALVYFARQIQARALEGLKTTDADKVKQALDSFKKIGVTLSVICCMILPMIINKFIL